MAKKFAGRPTAAPNHGNVYLRDQECKIRCSEGFNKSLEALVREGVYKSKADALHDALQLLAYKKLTKKPDLFWAGKIQ